MRPGSPPFGFSTLTTSAPSWASTSVQVGPASNCDRSSTRTPARQLGATAASVISILLADRWGENNASPQRPLWFHKGHEGAFRVRRTQINHPPPERCDRLHRYAAFA